MQTYQCPNGHTIEADGHEDVECQPCNLTATHLNRATGEVYTWMDTDAYRDSCESLQGQMDDAFDNQYFSGGW